MKNRKLSQICTALTFLIGSCGFAQTLPAAMAERPEIIVSVYDYAQMPSQALAAAEKHAQSIFRKAGVKTAWRNCLRKSPDVEVKNCHSVDATHLVMKILPRATATQVRDRDDVLGDAFVDAAGVGFYAYAFYDHIESITAEHKLGPVLLGCVLAHEIGHLLLGSRSHAISGIMSVHWTGEQLRRISEAGMVFLPSQSRALRNRATSLLGSSDPNLVSMASEVTNRQ